MANTERERDPVARIKKLLRNVLASLKSLLRLTNKELDEERHEAEGEPPTT